MSDIQANAPSTPAQPMHLGESAGAPLQHSQASRILVCCFGVAVFYVAGVVAAQIPGIPPAAKLLGVACIACALAALISRVARCHGELGADGILTVRDALEPRRVSFEGRIVSVVDVDAAAGVVVDVDPRESTSCG